MAAFTQLLYLSSLLGLVYKVFATKQQCGAELSVLGMMLQRHIYKKTVAAIGHECLFVCRQENRCQSFNFVISEGICELNNRTKEARPEDYVPNSDRYYFGRDWKRGKFKIVEKKNFRTTFSKFSKMGLKDFQKSLRLPLRKLWS